MSNNGVPRKYVIFAIWATALVAIDQATKAWARGLFPDGRGHLDVIDGLLMIVHAENKGAAFGMGNSMDAGMRTLVFAVFTLVALGVLVHMLWQLPRRDLLQSSAIGMIASGALGNAIDRVVKMQVTDFLRVYTDKQSVVEWMSHTWGLAGFCGRGSCEWPSWNVADAAIVVGLGLFVVHYLFFQDDDAKAQPTPPEDPQPEA